MGGAGMPHLCDEMGWVSGDNWLEDGDPVDVDRDTQVQDVAGTSESVSILFDADVHGDILIFSRVANLQALASEDGLDLHMNPELDDGDSLAAWRGDLFKEFTD